ncbi:MAG: signal peptidase II [bacterium]
MLNKKILSDNKLIFYGLVIVFVDQIIKRFLVIKFPSLVLINSNLAFGINFTSPLLLNILAILLFVVVIYFFQNKKILSVPVVLILSGAVSNLLDRIFLGGVADYIDFKIWPSFNLADALIFSGSVLLVLQLLKKKD